MKSPIAKNMGVVEIAAIVSEALTQNLDQTVMVASRQDVSLCEAAETKPTES